MFIEVGFKECFPIILTESKSYQSWQILYIRPYMIPVHKFLKHITNVNIICLTMYHGNMIFVIIQIVTYNI